jgi:hypothetical protein
MSDASGDVCLFVVGMHRSGTSAVAGALEALGLATPAGDDLLAPTTWNELGFYESKRLITVNNRLLSRLGGTWTAPPRPTAGWEDGPTFESLRAQASTAFGRAFPRRPMAWKDPRTCITLPFWRRVLEPPTAAVFVYRDPVEVAQSLRARGDAGFMNALALWDRYVRAATVNLVGLPVLAVDYGCSVNQPETWTDELVDFLGALGVSVEDEGKRRALASLDGTMRHQRPGRTQDDDLAETQRRMLEALRKHTGPHEHWCPIDLGQPPDWVDEVLALRLEADKLTRMEQILQTSRAFAARRFLIGLRSKLRRPG